MTRSRESKPIFISDEAPNSLVNGISFYYSPAENLLYYWSPESHEFILVTLDVEQLISDHNNDTTNVHGIVNTANLVTLTQLSSALANYLTTTAATNTYLTQSAAANTYASQAAVNSFAEDVADTYLSQTSFSTTIADYLTEADASTTYLSQSSASSTYLSQSSASSTYLTQSNAASTYATKSELTDVEAIAILGM